jgi:hypothetical protein
MMNTYQIGDDGYWTGATKEVAENAGIKRGWTRYPVPPLSSRQYAAWAGNGWAVVDSLPVAPPAYYRAAEAKTAVNGWIDRLLSQITGQYPRHEIDSWSTKGEAARAVVAGTARTDQTLLVQSEADMVSATLADQAALIVTKADQFAAIISLTSGLRQKTGTALDAATTPEQFAAIVDAALVEASASAAAHGLTV